MGRDLTKTHPRLQEKAALLIEKCRDAGIFIRIGECLRTVEEQDALYAQGRTAPGSIVTNSRGTGYRSMHQWGVAFDFYLDMDVDGDGKKTDDAFNNSTGLFEQVGAIGKNIGLEWGGDWVSIVDRPHFQLPDWGSTTEKLRETYEDPEAFFATWPKPTVPSTPESPGEAVPSSKEKVPVYRVGQTYTLQAEMRVRTGPGVRYRAKGKSELTADGKRHDRDGDGALDKGTKVTCQKIQKDGADIWIKAPSGWIAAYYKGRVYIR